MLTIPEKHLRNYLFASLQYCATSWKDIPGIMTRALEWYRQLSGQGFYHLPLFLIVDLGLLLDRGFDTPFASDKEFESWPESERAIRLRYENEILGRLLQEPVLRELLEFLHLEKNPKKREGPQTRLLELLFRRFAPHYPRETLVHPAHLRKLSPKQFKSTEIEEYIEKFEEFLGDEPLFTDSMSAFLDKVSHNLRWSELLREEDIFEIENWAVLQTEELRIGCRQILEMERRLTEINPAQVAIADESADAETAFVDETYYPTGGLSELTNRGSFENLVLSELMYIDDGPEIDLFDVRFVEGELLFYLRNAGLLRRKRRTIHLVIDLDDFFPLKTSGYEVQFSILAQGMALRIARDLLKVFEDDALRFHFHYIYHDLDPTSFAREMEIMQLLLADEVNHGWVEFSLEREIDPDSLQEDKRKVYVVAMTGKYSDEWDDLLELYLREKPPLYGVNIPILEHAPEGDDARLCLPLDGLSFEELIELKESIVSTLVGLRQ